MTPASHSTEGPTIIVSSEGTNIGSAGTANDTFGRFPLSYYDDVNAFSFSAFYLQNTFYGREYF